MTRPDFWEAEPGPMRRALLAPLSAAALVYGAAARAHRALYARGVRAPARLACKVVSVGNLSVGGSGKTPLAAWLARALHARGYRVALATRGYGRRGREGVEVVSDGRFVRSTAERAGDEPMLLAAHAPGVPVLVGPRRDVVGLRAIAAFGTQVLVLDDGFQHHRLAREADLVAVDGEAGFGNGRLLPRGPLREPPSALRHADAVAVVDGPLRARDEALLAEHAPAALRVEARRRASALRPLGGGESEPPEVLAGRAVGLLSGIARPASFRRTVEALGARVVAESAFRDHHRYRARDLQGLAREAPLWLTTEKDAVKLLPSWTRGGEVRVLALELEVDAPGRLLDAIEARLRPRPRRAPPAAPRTALRGARRV